MVDVIIPAYNAHNTITRTLSSIVIQTICSSINVYIIDDCSDQAYDKEIEFFSKFLTIKQLRNEKNMGAGFSRQKGIDKSNAKYIIFMDSDDCFYDCFSAKYLLDEIEEKNLDIVASYVDVNNIAIKEEPFGDLHGKIYRREFILKNEIRFNNTRWSEDNSFSQLAFILSKKWKQIDHITYSYVYNNTSLTKGNTVDTNILLSFMFNALWFSLECEKRNISKEEIAHHISFYYCYVYKIIKSQRNIDYQLIYKKGKHFEQVYLKYENYISSDALSNLLFDMFRSNELYKKIYKDDLLYDFKLFRNKFVR